MKISLKISLFFILATVAGCEEGINESNSFSYDYIASSSQRTDMVDPATNKKIQPIIHSFLQKNSSSALAPPNTDNWTLSFSDEFSGTAVDANKWTVDNSTTSRAPRPEIGINSWYWRPQNVEVTGGDLLLKATKEGATKMFCGSINSNNKYLPKYGFYEARIKIADINYGTHTAFWLQGPNMNNIDGTGNDGAEIDIFESAWTGDFTKAVIHIDGYAANKQASTKQYATAGIHSGYHTFGMWWTKDFIKIYYDGVFKVEYTDSKWIPWAEEFLWLSNGAAFGLGSGDQYFVDRPLGSLTQAYVDYIRVWQIPESLNMECETIADVWSPSNNSFSTLNHTLASGRQHVRLLANGIDDRIRFDNINVPVETTYNVSVSSLTWSSFGKYTCSISNNGSWHYFSPVIDLYAANSTSLTLNLGNVTLAAGNHSMTFKCQGKNVSSSNYVGSFDKITLTPVN
jgi:beta-glucanase (GH16 family)